MDYKKLFIRSFHKYPPIVKTFGMELSFDEDKSALITLPYNPNLDHGEGAVHGGAIATILDSAGWFTAALAIEKIVTTSEMSFHLFRPASKVKLIAKGKILKVGTRQVVTEMSCKDEDGNLIAHATGTYIIMNLKDNHYEKIEDLTND